MPIVCEHSTPQPETCEHCRLVQMAHAQAKNTKAIPACVVAIKEAQEKNRSTTPTYGAVNHNHIVIEQGAAGIGDGLLVTTAVAQLRKDFPTRDITLRVSAAALPFVALFDCCDTLQQATKDHTFDAIHGAYQANRGYHEENLDRLTTPRWERYRLNVGASACVVPKLRDFKRVYHLQRRYVGFVALCPYSTDPAREWSLHHWLALERLLLAAGYECVILHSGDNKRVGEFTSEKFLGKPAAEVASVMLNAACVLGSDSGLAHLGAILGTPTIVFGGNTDVSQIFGVYPAARFLQGPLACSNCCGQPQFTETRCVQSCGNLQAITPARVLDAVDELLLPLDAGGKTLVDWKRLRTIRAAVRDTNGLPGDMAELGVYKGGVAKLMLHYSSKGKLHLYDTFAGIPEDDQHGEHKRGDFGDTSAAGVRDFLNNPRAVFHAGFFPDTAAHEGLSYRCVHVDGDTYQTTLAALDYFVPRMSKGGVMIFDDYGWYRCQGVMKALHDTFPPERIEQTAGSFQAVVRF